MNKNSIEELNLKDKNINNNVLIINQTDNNKRIEYKNRNIRMLNYDEVGLSKNRNRALKNAKGNKCLIADDDIKYKEEGLDIIEKSFKDNPSADIITFQIETPEGTLFKEYSSNEFWHNKRTVLKVSSIEIAFRKDRIFKKNISFDENFGLGAKYNSGEENIFLMDCLKQGLKIKYVPIPIVIHPKESSGKNLTRRDSILSKGALFTRLFGWSFLVINVLFGIKKYKDYKDDISLYEFIKLLYKGSFNYIKELKEFKQ
jgi:hypothetical protein